MMTSSKEVIAAHELHKLLVNVVHLSKRGIVATGRVLYELKQDNLYKQAIGSGIDTWTDYLKQPEIGLSVAEAARMMQIYETFILRLNFDEDTISAVPIKNMYYLLPLVKKLDAGDEVDELVADATLLSQKDFKEKLYDIHAEKMGSAATRTYEYSLMRKTLETNTLDRVMDISSDMIIKTFNLIKHE